MDHAALLRLKDSAADIDLNSKMTHVQLRRERRRITWIRFHLSREQKWPTWATPSDSNSDEATYLGPLAGLEGCEKVWLGRLVADPEKAALIVRTYGPVPFSCPRPIRPFTKNKKKQSGSRSPY